VALEDHASAGKRTEPDDDLGERQLSVAGDTGDSQDLARANFELDATQ
jgi:hypothetical protein